MVPPKSLIREFSDKAQIIQMSKNKNLVPDYVISVPGKCFLVGEYLVLSRDHKERPVPVGLKASESSFLTFEGSIAFENRITGALVMGLEPRFELEVFKSKDLGQLGSHGIHSSSPAGKLLEAFRFGAGEMNSGYAFSFKDPFDGQGGFGASTAQFLSIYCFMLWRKALETKDGINYAHEREIDARKLMDSYLESAWDGTGYAPSGADLIAQLKGGITYFNKSTGQIQVYQFAFSDFEIHFVQTGVKVPTHEHLRTLKSFDSNGLSSAFALTLDGVTQSNSDKFVRGIQNYGEELDKLDLVAESTRVLLKAMKGWPEVLAAKGCGALGADVVMALVKSGSSDTFHKRWDSKLRQLTSKSISRGVYAFG